MAQSYYDEPVTDTLPPEKPPEKIETSDEWTARVIKAAVKSNDRQKRWPAVFNSKYLNSGYIDKGAASRQYDTIY